MRLVRRGELTETEVAALLGVNRSSVSRRCTFDVTAARRRFVDKVWRRASETKVSRAELKAQAEFAEGVMERYDSPIAAE